MRLVLILVGAVALAGCGPSARTVRPSDPEATAGPAVTTDRHGITRQSPEPLVAPFFKSPHSDVWTACHTAAMEYFHRIDQEDAKAGTLTIENNNFWAGDTRVSIRLGDADGGTYVDVSSEGKASNVPLWDRPRRDVTEFLHHLQTVMARPRESARSTQERLQELEQLHAQGLVTEAEYTEKRAQILSSL